MNGECGYGYYCMDVSLLREAGMLFQKKKKKESHQGAVLEKGRVRFVWLLIFLPEKRFWVSSRSQMPSNYYGMVVCRIQDTLPIVWYGTDGK